MTATNYENKVYCSKETKRKLVVECKNIFLKYHPEFQGFRLTEGFMLNKVVERYIEDDK